MNRAAGRALGRPAYFSIFRRNSTWIGFIVAGAFVTEFFSEGFTNTIWNANNRGVRVPRAPPSRFVPSTREREKETDFALVLQMQWADLEKELKQRKSLE